MPVFAFREQGLDPDLTLAHCLVIGFSRVIPPNMVQILLIKTAFDETAMITGGALWLEWTGVAGCGIALVAFLTLRIRHLG